MSENLKWAEVFGAESHKLKHCSCFMAGRELPTGEILLVGQNHCKSIFCLVCQSDLLNNRRRSIMEYLKQNKDKYNQYIPYMLTLTLQHDSKTRNYNYMPELLKCFNWLHHRNVQNKKYWDKYIGGGFYFVEITQKNDSPHICLHVFLLAFDELNGRFLKEIKKRWIKKTGGSNEVYLTNAYYKYKSKTKKGLEKETKAFFKKGDSIDKLHKVIVEAVKYTIKIESKDFERISDDTLYSLITTRKKYFGFFGCLYGKGITNADLSSLGDIEQTNKKLYSPTSGEGFENSDTRLVITHFNNTIEHRVINEVEEMVEGKTIVKEEVNYYYTLNDLRLVSYFTNIEEARKQLAEQIKITLPEEQQNIRIDIF